LRGQLAVLVPNGTGARGLSNAVEVGKKYRGDYFGEIALIKDSVRTAWVRADTFVLTSRLTRDYAESIWKHYPGERKSLAEMVVQTALADRQRARRLTETAGFTNVDLGDIQPESIADESGVSPPLAMSPCTVQQQQPMYAAPSVRTEPETMCTPASDALLEAAEGNIEPMARQRYDSDRIDPDDPELITPDQLSDILKEQVTETRKMAGNHRLQLSAVQRQQAALTAKVEAVLALLSTTKHGPETNSTPPATSAPAVSFGRAIVSQASKAPVQVKAKSSLDME